MRFYLLKINKFGIGAFLSNELIPGKNFTSYLYGFYIVKQRCTITVHK